VVTRLNEGIPVVYDVGANRGQYALDLRQHGYAGEIVSFEPVRAAYLQLVEASEHDAAWSHQQVALGGEEGEIEIHVASNLASSSLLEMRDAHRAAAPSVTVDASEVVRVARLDTLVEGDTRPCLLKIDVQGFEDRVLDGAGETLKRAALVECELSIAPLYDGQADFRAMIDRLDDAGFALVDLDPFFYDPADGRVLSVDAIFAR
jgi:FkbM family methyltransferase